MIKAKGLFTFDNELGSPEGSLDQAENAVIDRNDVIEPRRGFSLYGTSFDSGLDRAKQVFSYKGRILRHYYDNTSSQNSLQFDSNGLGIFQSFDGIYDDANPDVRIKGIESNGNFYFTTNSGIKKISASSAASFSTSPDYITNAGGVKALNVEGSVSYALAGFFEPESSVAYRIVFGITDENSNVILGSPSARLILYNTNLTESATTLLSFNLPAEITENHFYQIYRTSQAPVSVDPGEEFRLVLEEYITPSELTAGEVTLTDIVPDTFRDSGANLYTNPITGEGIANSNERPPLAEDIALFKGSIFFANTKTRHKKDVNLLSVLGLTTLTSSISITNAITSRTYTFVGETEVTQIDTVGSTPGGVLGSYFLINSSRNRRKYYVFLDDSTSPQPTPTNPDMAGRIQINVDLTGLVTAADIAQAITTAITAVPDFSVTYTPLSTVLVINHLYNGNVTDAVDGTDATGFSISVITQGDGEDSALNHINLSNHPSPSLAIDETARSLVNIVNSDALSPAYAYYMSGVNDVPGLILFESKSSSDESFHFTASDTTTGEQFTPTLPTSGSTVISSNESIPNRLYFSKYRKPEAVPIISFFDLGPKDKKILRIVSLRDSLFVFKEDGVYRVSGSTAPNFSESLFDSSAILIAPDAIGILNNQIYALTSLGVVSISDTGVSVMSRPIEDKILRLQSQSYVNFRSASFAVGYESDKSLLLWTVTNPSDTTATICYRFNVFTNAWTEWTIAKTCGVVNDADDKLYLGASDVNYIEKERKNFDRTDSSDRQYDLLINSGSITQSNPTLISLSSGANAHIGDVLVQTLYLTPYEFNQTLKSLDKDINVLDNDFYSTLSIVPGDNLTIKMSQLVNKLNLSDPSIITHTFAPVDVDPLTNTISISAHGFTNSSIIYFSTDTALPAGLVVNTKYYVVNSSINDFQVSLVSGGAPIDITGTGVGTHTVTDAFNFSGTSDFSLIQTQYNNVIEVLNIKGFKPIYRMSTGTKEYEYLIIDKIRNSNKVIVDIVPFIVQGPITLFDAIKFKITYKPQTFGDSEIYKQIGEAKVMVERDTFTSIDLSYASDISPNFEPATFDGSGIGNWGRFNWGNQTWGGEGFSAPIRTYIPLEKQRCRFLRTRIEHNYARRSFKVLGLDFVPRGYSKTAYK